MIPTIPGIGIVRLRNEQILLLEQEHAQVLVDLL
jgi:hypothetical protein